MENKTYSAEDCMKLYRMLRINITYPGYLKMAFENKYDTNGKDIIETAKTLFITDVLQTMGETNIVSTSSLGDQFLRKLQIIDGLEAKLKEGVPMDEIEESLYK